MPSAHSRLGAAGEAIARRHLEGIGFTWLESNWRCPAGEIDVVMLDGKELVFVEVKLRRGEASGRAEDSVSPSKGKKLLASGGWYLQEHPEVGDPIWRIDLLAITLDRSGRVERVSHIENAVIAE